MELVITCDGSYRKEEDHPGVATYGWLVRQGAYTLHQENGIVCRGRSACNLTAEYGALVAALQWICRAKLPAGSSIEIRVDCEFVVKHLHCRLNRHRRRGFVMLFRTAAACVASLKRRGCRVQVVQVHRKRVADAHTLCRAALQVAPDRHVKRSPAPLGLKEFLRRARPGTKKV